jgi:hypothetical protein
MGEEAHGGAEAISAEPAQHFLRAVRGKYYGKRQAQNGYRGVVAGMHYFLQHSRLALRSLYAFVSGCSNLAIRLTNGLLES